MLSILLLLATAPQVAEAPTHTLRPATVEELIGAGVVPPMPRPRFTDGNAVGTPVLSDQGFGCESRPTQTNDMALPGAGLTWREGGQPVGLYRLLDRRVNGCPDPVVVNYRVPGSDAVGREATRQGPAAEFIRVP